jgi:hypothetical protein
MWEIQKLISKGVYWYCKVPEHPKATKLGYVFHHRIVMENYLGRLLLENEVVHHKDGNKRNNVIENLEVLDSREHNRLHGLEQGITMCYLKCPHCDTIFEREYRLAFQTSEKKYGVFCSRSCSGKFSRYAQLHELTHEMKKAISENLLMKFKRFQDNSEETID